MNHYSTYVLITPARNEAAFIERTIESVVMQKVLPAKWIIVSDGSSDCTDEIVKKYAALNDWIELIRMPERKERHFAGKVHAFQAGYARLKDLTYDIIGSLDADISFDEDYFAFLLSKFAGNPRLGVAGTPFREGSFQYDYRFTSIEHVSGACQLFRRQCFEDIGGYVPMKGGGIDLAAVVTARMKGWQTRSFPEKTCEHYRKMGTGMHAGWMVPFRGGRQDYLLGSHQAWEVLRAIYQMRNRPLVIGGALRLAGFYWAMLTGVERTVSKEFIEFRRAEQMQRLHAFIKVRFTSAVLRLLSRGQETTATSRSMLVIVEDKEIAISGTFLRIARLRAEYYEWVIDPASFIAKLRGSSLGPDLFTFLQSVHDVAPRYDYDLEWQSISVLPITTYEYWWKEQINDKTRNMIRKAAKCRVDVKVVPFTDDLVRGIEAIHNESPIRMGKPFPHYGKDFQAVKREHISYADRSDFIGAFYDDQLIGFSKLVHGQGISHLMQIISMIAHRDKAPTNALVAKAIEICAQREIPYLHYGVWSRRGLGDFKKHHAFEKFNLPRYFVPLTVKGEVLLKLNMHHKLSQRLPEEWVDRLVRLRSGWNSILRRRNRRRAVSADPNQFKP